MGGSQDLGEWRWKGEEAMGEGEVTDVLRCWCLLLAVYLLGYKTEQVTSQPTRNQIHRFVYFFTNRLIGWFIIALLWWQHRWPQRRLRRRRRLWLRWRPGQRRPGQRRWEWIESRSDIRLNSYGLIECSYNGIEWASAWKWTRSIERKHPTFLSVSLFVSSRNSSSFLFPLPPSLPPSRQPPSPPSPPVWKTVF